MTTAAGKGSGVEERNPSSSGGPTEFRYTDRRYAPACAEMSWQQTGGRGWLVHIYIDILLYRKSYANSYPYVLGRSQSVLDGDIADTT